MLKKICVGLESWSVLERPPVSTSQLLALRLASDKYTAMWSTDLAVLKRLFISLRAILFISSPYLWILCSRIILEDPGNMTHETRPCVHSRERFASGVFSDVLFTASVKLLLELPQNFGESIYKDFLDQTDNYPEHPDIPPRVMLRWLLRWSFQKALFPPSSVATISNQKISRPWIFHDEEDAHSSAPISIFPCHFFRKFL